jgi:hypothetical protein
LTSFEIPIISGFTRYFNNNNNNNNSNSNDIYAILII